MATKTDYSGIEIEVVQGRDVGCEITEAEWERLEQAQIDALERAFAGAQIAVHTVDGSRSTAVDVSHEDPDDESAELPDEADVTAVLDEVWDAGSFWRPESTPLAAECALSSYRRTDAYGVALLVDDESRTIVRTEALEAAQAKVEGECPMGDECDCEERLWRAARKVGATTVGTHGSSEGKQSARSLVIEAVEAGLIDLADAAYLGHPLDPAQWGVVDVATREVLPGRPDVELLERSLRATQRGGCVAASLDETAGTWSWLDDSAEARAVARGERVASVFVEAA